MTGIFISHQAPGGFEVAEPSRSTLNERQNAAIASGVRPIQTPWPSQEPRTSGAFSNARELATRARTRGLSFGTRGTGSRRPRGEYINSRGNAFDHSTFVRRGSSRGRTTNNISVLLSSPVEEFRSARDRSSPPLGPRSPGTQVFLNGSLPGQKVESGPTRRPSPPTRNPSRGGYPRASFVQAPPQADRRTMPIMRNEEWRKWPRVTVKLSGLPLSVETYDLYIEFEQFGDLEMIQIHENDRAIKTGQATIRFMNPVTSAFWEEPFEWQTDKMKPVSQQNIKLQPPTRSYKIISPVNQNRVYPEIFKFNAKTLEFGFMYKPDVMMAMYKTKPIEEVTFEVNLYRRLIDISFRIYLNKEEHDEAGIVEEEDEDQQPVKDRFEHYRFRVPFSQLDKLYEGPSSEGRKRNFILPLPSPPMFWRKLHDVLKSHEIGATYWTSFDAWYRQTAIVYNGRARQLRCDPISLRQSAPIIDMGRWTCYRFDFDLDQEKAVLFDRMIQALKDFNVDTKVYNGFEVAGSKEQLVPIWDFLDSKQSRTDSDLWSLAELMENKPVLPYSVRYQLEVCISRNCLNEYNMNEDFIRYLAGLEEHEAVGILEHVAERKARVYNPIEIFSIQDIKKASTIARLPEYCMIMRRAIITPSTIYFGTPSVETTNRVLRNFSEVADRFLRVQFKDEVGKINQTEKRSMHEVFTRVNNAFDHGITIGDRHFEFLACGNSQMREHGAYFFASTEHIKAADIRRWMGQFSHIRNVAKHAARLGQCFSTSRAINTCKVEIREIPDVERNGYTFTDGVGKLSSFLAKIISAELDPTQSYSSCFQFRLGGCKGVLAVWPGVEGREVHIRPSQRKFETAHNQLEVIRCSRFSSANLNRQLIIVLSCLGIGDGVFVKKLTEMLRRYEQAVKNPDMAVSLLRKNIDPNQSTLQIAAMVRNGFMQSQEPFVVSLLHLWRAWTIKYLKEKAKIMIDEGAFLLGVTDEAGILKGYGTDGSDLEVETSVPEIFCKISDPTEPGKFKVITGTCIIARNPALHPGDVRTVKAVDVPELHHLVDVVVFPQQGERDLPSMLSGGDLDGDDYIVIWDTELTTSVHNHSPMNYFAQSPRELDRDVEIKDITAFYVNYMKNDRLGVIANNHLAWADKLTEGVKSDKCYQLAALHSDAVDYPKTGEPAQMTKALRCHPFPHFFEREPDKSYQSEKILGQLYDMVERIDFIPDYNLEFNQNIIQVSPADPVVLKSAREIKSEYDAALRRVMAQYAIKTEFEVFSTFVLSHDMGSRDYKFHEEMGNIAFSLKDRYQKQVMGTVGATSLRDPKLEDFVAAMYVVTAQDVETARAEILDARKKAGRRRPVKDTTKNIREPRIGREDIEKLPLMSFPWIFGETLGQLALRGSGVRGSGTEIQFEDFEVSEIPEPQITEIDVESLQIDNHSAILQNVHSFEEVMRDVASLNVQIQELTPNESEAAPEVLVEDD